MRQTIVNALVLVVAIGWAAPGLPSGSFAASPSGALVLQFDDGYAEWRTEAAPLLARHEGRATAFVCDQYIQSGRIRMSDLRELQDQFGWEIGTHTARHISAPRVARMKGVDRWRDHELRPSLENLEKAGLRVHSMVFPFNDWTPELAACVKNAGLVFRDATMHVLVQAPGPNGSFPGVSMDTVKWIPWPTLKSWVDTAAQEGAGLFLYGHRVLPDDAFVEASVVRVEEDRLELDADIRLAQEEPLALVPDTERARAPGPPWMVRSITGRVVQVEGGDLRQATAPGRRVLVGPSYGTRVSDLTRLLEYAAPRLRFLTVHEFVAERSGPRGAPEGDASNAEHVAGKGGAP